MTRDPHSTRRKVLKSSAAIGAITAFTSPVSGSNETVEIPIVEHQGEVLHRKEFPKEWKESIDHVKSVYNRKRTAWKDKRGVRDINRVKSEEKIGDKYKIKINVEVIPEEYEGGIPDQVEGVPIQISEWIEGSGDGCGINRDDYSNIPGGVVNGQGSEGFGTSCCRIWDGDKYTLLTAQHFLDNDGDSEECESVYGETLYQSGQEVGEIDTVYITEDFVLAKCTNSSLSLSQDVMTDSGRLPMRGAVTDYDAMMADDETVEATGVTLGYVEGEVDAYPVSQGDCHDLNNHGVRTTCKSASGDSGGPAYWRYPYDGKTNVALVHVNSHGHEPSDPKEACNGSDIAPKRSGVSGKRLEQGYGWGIGIK